MNYNIYVLKNDDRIVALYTDYEKAESDRNFLEMETSFHYNIILYSCENTTRYLERGEVTC